MSRSRGLLVAGGLRATTDEYATLLALLFHNGTYGGEHLISEALVRRMGENHYPDATLVTSPMQKAGYDFRLNHH